MNKLLSLVLAGLLGITSAILPNAKSASASSQEMTVHFTSLDLQKTGISKINADRHAYWLSYFAKQYGITTNRRKAHFLAQLAHESGGFQWSRELWGPTYAQRGYEGRRDLGNIQPGDGYRFRGRGLIQLTGRYNYTRLSKAMGFDIVARPDMLSSPKYAVQSAYIYWNWINGNAKADSNDLRSITRAINGGYNGYADRSAWFGRFSRLYPH